MIVSAASQAQRSGNFITGIEHKESLQECQISPKGCRCLAREHGIDTRIPGFAHRDQDETGFPLSWNGSIEPGRPNGFPGHGGSPYERNLRE